MAEKIRQHGRFTRPIRVLPKAASLAHADRSKLRELGVQVPTPERILTTALKIRRRTRSGRVTGCDEFWYSLGYAHTPNVLSFDKMFERDKQRIRQAGLEVRFQSRVSDTGEGYTLATVEMPPIKPPVLCDWKRWFYILHAVEHGERPTVKDMAARLGVKPSRIRKDLEGMSLCRAGEEPHQFLDAREERGRIVITGPRLYS